MSEKFSVFAKTAWLYPARLKGGHVQPQVQVRIITNLVDFGMTVQEAIAAARFNHNGRRQGWFGDGHCPNRQLKN
jgi:gamma-glutamyltranspeptidase